MKLDFSQQIFETYSNINLMEICPVGAELLHADGQSDGHYEGHTLFKNF